MSVVERKKPQIVSNPNIKPEDWEIILALEWGKEIDLKIVETCRVGETGEDNGIDHKVIEDRLPSINMTINSARLPFRLRQDKLSGNYNLVHK